MCSPRGNGPQVAMADFRGRIGERYVNYFTLARVLPVATKEAIRVAQNLLANKRIGVCAHNDSAGLAAGGPTDNISFRRIARHDCYARRRVRVSLLDIRALPVRLPSIGR